MAIQKFTMTLAMILTGSVVLSEAQGAPVSSSDSIIVVDPCDKPPQERPKYCNEK